MIVRAFDLVEDMAKDSLKDVKDGNEIVQSHQMDVEALYVLGITSGKRN